MPKKWKIPQNTVNKKIDSSRKDFLDLYELVVDYELYDLVETIYDPFFIESIPYHVRLSVAGDLTQTSLGDVILYNPCEKTYQQYYRDCVKAYAVMRTVCLSLDLNTSWVEIEEFKWLSMINGTIFTIWPDFWTVKYPCLPLLVEDSFDDFELFLESFWPQIETEQGIKYGYYSGEKNNPVSLEDTNIYYSVYPNIAQEIEKEKAFYQHSCALMKKKSWIQSGTLCMTNNYEIGIITHKEENFILVQMIGTPSNNFELIEKKLYPKWIEQIEEPPWKDKEITGKTVTFIPKRGGKTERKGIILETHYPFLYISYTMKNGEEKTIWADAKDIIAISDIEYYNPHYDEYNTENYY